MNPTIAWMLLVVLSACSTLVAMSGWIGTAATIALLLLSWVKAQLILRHYLGLARAPGWSRGFATVLAFYMLILMGLAMTGNDVQRTAKIDVFDDSMSIMDICHYSANDVFYISEICGA